MIVDCMIGDVIKFLDLVVDMINKEAEFGIENEVMDEDLL